MMEYRLAGETEVLGEHPNTTLSTTNLTLLDFGSKLGR
jgi:hypothetical protein